MKLCKILIFAFAACVAFVSCEETNNTYDPYENWQERNAAWWECIVRDSVHAAIDKAKAQWGEHWQEHCQWRMIRTLYKIQNESGIILDSICVKDLGNDLTGEELQEFIDNIQSLSVFDETIDITSDDKLLTLSTCNTYTENGRMFVVAKRIK